MTEQEWQDGTRIRWGESPPERRHTCLECGTEYVVPAGKVPRAERTANMGVAAHAVTWALDAGQRVPASDDVILHECKRGKVVLCESEDPHSEWECPHACELPKWHPGKHRMTREWE